METVQLDPNIFGRARTNLEIWVLLLQERKNTRSCERENERLWGSSIANHGPEEDGGANDVAPLANTLLIVQVCKAGRICVLEI